MGMKAMLVRTVISALACFAGFFAAVHIASADEAAPEDEQKFIDRTLSVGIGAGYMGFDTNFKFTEISSGQSVFVDAEGSLGLPEHETIPLIYGFWRPSEKHGLGFSYFNVRRQAQLLGIDESFGDLDVVGDIYLTDQSRFYALTYNYTFFQDSRAFLFASFGINGIDLKYRLDAEGSLILDDEPIASGEYTESINQIAPIPMIGLDAWFVLTPKWSFGAKASFIAGKFNDISALITGARIRAKYTFNRNVGVYFGLSYFDGDIKIEDKEDDLRTDIVYGFDGLFVGVDVGF